MESAFFYEAIGYLASVLVAVSLMMSRIVPLRIVNMLGAATFVVYGVLITSWPVAGMNAFIVLINIYYLVQIYGNKSSFKILKMRPDEQYLSYFTELHESGIREYHPELSSAPEPGSFNLMVLRDTLPAGLLMGHKEGDTLRLSVDFVSPDFRDFKIGRFIYEQQREFFKREGIRKIIAYTSNEAHAGYFKKMGFAPSGSSLKLEL